MRSFILLLLALAVAILFALFPEIVSQGIRIEAFGWVFETRQGAFITALLILLGLFWLLRRVLSAIVAGPGQLWATLRMGSKKRRQQRLREGLADLINTNNDQGRRAIYKSRGSIPDWGHALLKIMTRPHNELSRVDVNGEPLAIALAARIATDPDATSKLDVSVRKAHLEAWHAAYPDSPLATSRMAALAEEESDWPTVVRLLEQLWKQGHRSAASIKPRLAHAYIHLADSDTENCEALLRKAQRLEPGDDAVVLKLGQAYQKANMATAAEKIWLSHLQQKNDFTVAAALFEKLRGESLQAFRKLDKKDAASTYQPAMRWLQACLAHDAGLNGLAVEIMDELLESDPDPAIIRTRADWYGEEGNTEQAAALYRRLSVLGTGDTGI